MGWFSSAAKWVKEKFSAAVDTAVRWGGKVVETVKKTWDTTKRVLAKAAVWCLEKVESVARSVARMSGRLVEILREMFSLNPEATAEQVAAAVRQKVMEIIRAAEAVQRGEALTSFGAFLEATAALRIAKSWLGLPEFLEHDLLVIRSLHSLVVAGSSTEDDLRRVDDYCRTHFAGSLQYVGGDTLMVAWVQEQKQVAQEIEQQAIELDDYEVRARKARRRGDIPGAASLEAESARMNEEVERELRPRLRQLGVAAGALQGLLVILNGEETSKTMVRLGDRAQDALLHWQLSAQLTQDEQKTLTDFANAYLARARVRAAKVMDEELGGKQTVEV